MTTIATIRPGLLVALRSTVTGGVHYQRTTLEESAERERWETIRVIDDPEEHARAIKVRGAAIALVRAVCSRTSFGLLCPSNAESDLDKALNKARELTQQFNASATYTTVSIHALKGHIADNDTEAAEAIGAEVVALIESMNTAIDQLDPKAIRDAANKARQLQAVLSEDAAQTVGEAVKQARTAARAVVKRVEKGGETGAEVLRDLSRGAIDKARMAFLDMSDPDTILSEAPSVPSVVCQRFADLELDTSDEGEPAHAL